MGARRRAGKLKPGLLCVVALAAAMLLTPTQSVLAAEASPPPKLWRTCEKGSSTGQCTFPNGIASDPETGHLYVADSSNSRINELTAWGEFVKAWGWGVVASGPDDKPKNEIQEVTVDATAGSFKLRPFNTFFKPTAPIPFDASAATVQAALSELEGADEQEKLTPGDVAVSGPAGGPWVIEFVGDRADTDMRQMKADASGLSGGAATATVATVQEGANFERCIPANGDVCRAAQSGAMTGELDAPQGVAVDSNSGIYVVERGSKRVQKFDREGHFLLMIGGDVNKTKVEEGGKTEAERNLCTAFSGDVCQAGTTGTGNGQFGSWESGSFITVGPGDTVYVGDQNRIQKFSTAGAYEGEIALAGTVAALAADPETGQLYLNLQDKKPDVLKIGPSGEAVCSIEDAPGIGVRSLAADPAGHLYVVIVLEGGQNRVHAFNSDCTPDEEIAPFGGGELSNSTNIATGTACLTSGHDIYVSNGDPSRPDGHFVRAYGPAPDKAGLCPPPPNPPTIEEQFAASVDTTGATLKAKINPRFWANTTFYLEYGNEPCSEGGCQQQPPAPGGGLGAGVVGDGVTRSALLEGLSPDTTYHYRFVAISHCVASEPEVECVTFGADRSFRTFRQLEPPACSANEASRIGFGAALPDCRAYEMVSPVDKDGGDIVMKKGTLGQQIVVEQTTPGGDKLTFGSTRAFGDASSAPFNSDYIAQRIEGQEWQTHSINPPRARSLLGPVGEAQRGEFQAFSPDLCEAWQVSFGDPPLAQGALAGSINLYRRTDQLCSEDGEPHYETLAPKPSSSGLLGVSGDGASTIFLSRDKLTPDGTQGTFQLYLYTRGEGLRFACVLPDRSPAGETCTGGGADISGSPLAQTGRISAEGRRFFFTVGSGKGRLYLRQNPTAPESARLHGVATGKGDLIGPAKGTGLVINGSELVKGVELESGKFAVGQKIADSGGAIPTGATIVKIEEVAPGMFTLTLSAKAKANKPSDGLIGEASERVSGLTIETGAFQAGQEISASGIPSGASVVSCSPSCGLAATSLVLSAKATGTEAGAALSAISPCTEAATKACTVQISKAAEETGKERSSIFWGAAADGSKAIFTTGSLENGAALYSFDVDSETASLIAEGAYGVMGVSEDADHIYFASRKVLDAGAVAEEPNLYLYEAGEGGGSTTFIGTLVSGDMFEVASDKSFVVHTSRVAADGLHAAFRSTAPLTGYDNTAAPGAPCGGAGAACSEVYLYDAEADELHCVSCSPSGARPAGAARVPAFVSPDHAARTLTDDGNRLYFESADALTPRDTNGKIDVYQWEEPDTGTCEESSPTYSLLNEGCVDLISSGKSPIDSRFVEATPSGDDAFFATGSSLLPQDPGSVDIYDARVDGGLPIPAGPAPGCEGEACQGAVEAPNDPTPASLSFEGAGNVREAAPIPRKSCAKGKVRRHGKCVARKHFAKKHRRAKRNRRAAR